MRKLGKGDIKLGRQKVADFDLEYPDLPAYIRALSEAGTPWASCMHDPGYGPKLAPFLPQLMEVAPPAVIVTHRPGSFESGDWAMDAGAAPARHVETPYLPYASTPQENRGRRVVGMTGRYINNKGQPTLVAAAAEGLLPLGWDVAIGGASPLGAGPNHTFLTFESLTGKHYKYEGYRQGNGNVTTGDPWRVSVWGNVIDYDGPYDDGVSYSTHHGIHVNATEVGFSGAGSLEYSDLEAIDAGCLLVLPTHRNQGQAYVASEYELTKCANAELSPIDDARRETIENLARAVTHSAEQWSDQPGASTIREANRQATRDLNHPGRYAEKILAAVAGE
jgi:hypothetical protein